VAATRIKYRGYSIQAFKLRLIKTALRLFQLLPLRLAHAIGSIIGWLLYVCPSKAKKVTRRNLQLCFPEKSSTEIKSLTLQSLQETAKTAFELGRIWLDPVPKVLKLVIRVVGEDIMKAAVDAGKGVLLLAPHLGSWELYGLHISNYAPTTYMYKPPKMDGFETVMTRFRARGGAALAPTDRRGVMQLLRALERGEIVGILPDQEPNRSSGVFAPFFGIDALTMTLASKLAAKTDAAVVCGFARRLADSSGFEIIFKAADKDIASEDASVAAAALNRTVEACVCVEPAQYQWEYKRFSKRPPKESKKIYS